MTHYLVYKITNKIDGKFYIGTHKTNNLEDGYMGSGKYLKHAINKYGGENFSKEILFDFTTAEEMFAKEAEIVNEDFLATENTYNLRVGGFGGFDYINSNREELVDRKYTPERRKNTGNYKKGLLMQRKLKQNSEYMQQYLKNLSNAVRRRILENGFWWNDKKHKESTKELIGMKNSILQSGKKNSQFGTEWITNGIENRKIKKGLNYPEGFRRGRTI